LRKMARSTCAIVVLVLSQRADSLIVPSRTSVPRMEQVAPEPFSTECVHVFDANLGPGNRGQLALARVSDERRAKLAFWRIIYEHEAASDANRLARAEAELRATMALSTGSGSMTFGAYLDAPSMNAGDEHAIALVRVEGDTPNKVMIVDMLLVSPQLPKKVRPALHAVVVHSLQAIGKAEEMSLTLWSDFGI